MKPVAASPFASLVIPCYNEGKSLPALIARCAAQLNQPDLEVILVDNGSRDDSAAILAAALPHPEAPGLRSIRVPVNQGYGHGILAGLDAAEGRVLGWTHADLQTDPADLLAALPLFRQAADPDRVFVKGRRSGRPIGDVLFTQAMSAFESLYLGYRMVDINAQPTLFGRGFYARIRQDAPADFALDLYAYFCAREQGLDVRRIPVHFGARLHGQSHWNVNWRGKVKFIRRTLAFSAELKRRLRARRS